MMNDNKALERASERMSTDSLELYCRNLSKAKNDLTKYDRALLLDVSDRLCELQSALEQTEPPNEPLTLEELRKRTKPVWCDTPGCSWIPEGGYYCLCENGMITTPSRQTFQAEECLKSGWILLDRKPDGGGE